MADHQRIVETAAEQKNKANEEHLLNQNSNLISGKVISVLKDGVLVVEWQWVNKDNGLSLTEVTKQMLAGTDSRTRALYAGIFKEEQAKHGNKKYHETFMAEWMAYERFINAVKKLNILKANDVCFIKMDTTGITDNSRILGYYCSIGTYRYTAVNGAAKTVPRYTADRKAALEYLKNNK